MPLKRSPEYRAIRRRVASLKPADSWQVDGLSFFVFELQPADGADATSGSTVTPSALFTIRYGETAPVCAIIVTPSPGGESVEVVDLRRTGSVYTMPLSPA